MLRNGTGEMVSVAVLGCGYWGPNLLRNFAENSCFRLVACANANADRLERLAWRYPGVCFTTDYEQVLHDDAIDAIAISSLAEIRYPLAREALLCGEHVLVEKPLATSVAHAEELVQTAWCKVPPGRYVCTHA